MEFGQKKIREIDLFDFTNFFFAWTFFNFLACCCCVPFRNGLEFRKSCLLYAVTDTKCPGRITKSCLTSLNAGSSPSLIMDAVIISLLAGSQGTTL